MPKSLKMSIKAQMISGNTLTIMQNNLIFVTH